jgi:hypothetical protein
MEGGRCVDSMRTGTGVLDNRGHIPILHFQEVGFCARSAGHLAYVLVTFLNLNSYSFYHHMFNS